MFGSRPAPSLLRPLWTRLPRWFAVELDDPLDGPVQVGPSWVVEADAIRALLAGSAPELPPPARHPYEVAEGGTWQWRYLVLYRTRFGTWLVARTGSRALADRIADHLNRSLADPDGDGG